MLAAIGSPKPSWWGFAGAAWHVGGQAHSEDGGGVFAASCWGSDRVAGLAGAVVMTGLSPSRVLVFSTLSLSALGLSSSWSLLLLASSSSCSSAAVGFFDHFARHPA